MASLVTHTREWLGTLNKHKITLSLVGHWFCNFDGFLWFEMSMVPKRDSIHPYDYGITSGRGACLFTHFNCLFGRLDSTTGVLTGTQTSKNVFPDHQLIAVFDDSPKYIGPIKLPKRLCIIDQRNDIDDCLHDKFSTALEWNYQISLPYNNIPNDYSKFSSEKFAIQIGIEDVNVTFQELVDHRYLFHQNILQNSNIPNEVLQEVYPKNEDYWDKFKYVFYRNHNQSLATLSYNQISLEYSSWIHKEPLQQNQYPILLLN